MGDAKTVESFLLPTIGLLGLIGMLAWLIGRLRLGQGCLVASVFLLVVCGWSPIGAAALMALEDRFPQPNVDRPVTGVIVLGGAVDTHISSDRHTLAINEAGERLTATVDLSRRYPGVKFRQRTLTRVAVMRNAEFHREPSVVSAVTARRKAL